MPKHDDTPQNIPQEIIDKYREGKGDELMKALNSRPFSAQFEDAAQEKLLDVSAVEVDLAHLFNERDKALKRADFAESVARRAAADAHDAIKARHEAEAQAVRWYQRIQVLDEEHEEARRHLRQLLHALDKMRETNGEEYISANVADAMLEARRYLQAPAGREDSD